MAKNVIGHLSLAECSDIIVTSQQVADGVAVGCHLPTDDTWTYGIVVPIEERVIMVNEYAQIIFAELSEEEGL